MSVLVALEVLEVLGGESVDAGADVGVETLFAVAARLPQRRRVRVPALVRVRLLLRLLRLLCQLLPLFCHPHEIYHGIKLKINKRKVILRLSGKRRINKKPSNRRFSNVIATSALK